MRDLPDGPVVKNPPANAGDTGSISAPEDSLCCRATKPHLKPLDPEAGASQ